MEGAGRNIVATPVQPVLDRSLSVPPPPPPPPPVNNRKDFPDDFVFGTATSAYQVEGAAAKDGKGISIWDDFTLRTPNIDRSSSGKIIRDMRLTHEEDIKQMEKMGYEASKFFIPTQRIDDGSNGNIACDMYNRYKEDITSMKKLGFDAYRFSISWTRILPSGRPTGGVNEAAIKYYDDLINTVIENGMEPYATLFHWDTPLILQNEYGGFSSEQIVEDFREYAKVCFFRFADRVKKWTTIVEPWTYTVHGYVKGTFPPSKASCPLHQAVKTVQSYKSANRVQEIDPLAPSSSDTTYDKTDPKEAYTVARNLLLAHSEAVHLYRNDFKYQGGQIGIVLNSHWYVPFHQHYSEKDKTAVLRAVEFMLGWFLEPVLYGEYPKSMIEKVPANNLTRFSIFEKEKLKGSVDFVGLNYYTTNYVEHDYRPRGTGYDKDQQCEFNYSKSGQQIGDSSGSAWQFIVPWGICELLKYMGKTYPELPSLYITENGVSDNNDHNLTAKQACNDQIRIQHYKDHLAYIKQAMEECVGLVVKGYFVSWCDGFEWAQGYTARFGIIYTDYMNNLTRYPKDSAFWFANFLNGQKKLKKRENEEIY